LEHYLFYINYTIILVGQIEDVIIKKEYCGLGLGKQIIKKLTKIGINKYKCYKIILSCIDRSTGIKKID